MESLMKSLFVLLRSLAVSMLFVSAVWATEKVNINSADAATIDRVLLNIGPAKAEAIVAYRKQNGAFRSVEQLAMVKGVGLKTIEKNRDRIVLGAAARTSASKQKPGATPAKR